MDITFEERDSSTAIYSSPATGTVYINIKDDWGDIVEYSPKYANKKGRRHRQSTEDYVTRGLGWEGFMKVLNDFQGIGTTVLLDNACAKSKYFYDMFLGIHH